MGPCELNRMFDRLAPTAEQEEAVLNRLLEPEKKEVFPMKRLKKMTVAGIAAALMVLSCAAAVVTGLDQRLIDYLGGGEQVQELLAPGAEALDITVTDNGATLHITQVLMDRYSALVLAEFTIPEGAEGTILDEKMMGTRFDTKNLRIQFVDENNAELNETVRIGGAWGWEILEDDNPTDNHFTMLFRLHVSENARLDQADYLLLDAENLIAWDVEQPMDEGRTILYPGDWSSQIPLSQKDTGWSQQTDDPIVKEIYLSPMNVQLSMSLENLNRERVDEWVTLTSPDGQTVSAQRVFGGGTGTGVGDLSWQRRNETFRLTEVTDPAQFQGGTLSLVIGGKSVEIPLDNLVPAEQ